MGRRKKVIVRHTVLMRHVKFVCLSVCCACIIDASAHAIQCWNNVDLLTLPGRSRLGPAGLSGCMFSTV